MKSFKLFTTAIRLILTLLVILNFSNTATAQMRQQYVDNVADNQIYKLSFYSTSEGYVAFRDWIGYTTDSGRTFTKKYITNGNVNFNGYNVNLTFGFGIKGVKAFNQNMIIAYGDYGLIPAILYSTNGGTSYTLVYHSQFNAFELTTGITDMIFPQNGSIGYAIDGDRILKTTNQGLSWSPVFTSPNSCFDHLDAIDDNNVFVISDYYTGDILFPNGRTFINNKIVKTSNTGASWQSLSVPSGFLKNISLITAAKGWLNVDQNLFYTSNTGATWVQKNNSNIMPPFYAEKFKFVNDSTGYALRGLFQIEKTTDSGKVWEPLPRDNNYTYLGYSHNDLQFLSATQLWAGGGHGFLEMTTNTGGTRLPKAYFSIDTTGLSLTGNVNLVNYSRTIYTYQWFLNNALISTNYNTSYTHDINRIRDTVKLIVSNGVNSDTSILTQNFYPPVIVASFTPTSAATGNVVSITGNNFSGATSVSFGGVAASSFNVMSNTSINATVGSGASGSVKVITPTGQGSLAGFTFISPPTITSFTPISAAAGTTITITGTNFIGVTAVSLGGIPATSFVVVSPTTITTVAPSGPSGSLTVVTPGGTATLAGYISLPTITSFTPTSGTEGTILIITGTSLNGTIAVTVGGINAVSFTVNSSTSISAVVGSGATGSVMVTKTGGSFTLPGFTWVAPPVITSFSPGAGPVGTSVAITGTGFNAIAANNIVYFGAVKAIITGGNSTSFTVTVPVGATFEPISVLNNNLISYSNYPFLVTFLGGSIAAHSFATRTIISTVPEHYPTNINLGDIDGDGKTDLAVVHYSQASANNGVLLYRNTSSVSSVSFDNPVNLGSLDYVAAALGDIDGDGKLDLAVIKGNSVATFLNTSTPGNISFAAGAILGAANSPHGITIGDVDGDGKADIVVDHYPNTIASVFRNTSEPGAISFAARVNYTVGGAKNILLIDLNGDNKPEMVIPDAGNNNFSVLKNNCTKGNILFDPAISFTGYGLAYMGWGDIDGDGKPDLVSSNTSGPGGIAIFRNTSTITNFSFAAPVLSSASSAPESIALSDLDGDGKLDIAATLDDYNLAVFKNQSTPGNILIAPKVNYTAGTYNGIHMLGLGDINGDGFNDAVVISTADRKISIHLNDISSRPFIQSFTPASGTIGTSVTITGSNFSAVTNVRFGGVPASSFVINSSTSITAIVGTGATGTVSVSTSQDTSSLPGFKYLPYIASFIPTSGIAGTIVTITGHNLNGITNVSFGGASAASFTIVSNTTITAIIGLGASGNISVTDTVGSASLGTFTFISLPAPVITSIAPVSAAAGATVTITGSNFNIIPQSNNVHFGSVKAQIISGSATSLSVIVPNGSTYEPITVTNNFLIAISPQKFFTLFPGGTSFTNESFATKIDSSANALAEVYFNDLNGDGKLDVIISGANGIATLRNTSQNNGMVSFDTRQDFATNFYSNKVAIADFDGDGRADVALSTHAVSNPKTLGVIRNISTSSMIKFDTAVLFTNFTSELGNLTAGDFDADGKIDIAVADYYANKVSIYRNITVGASINFAPKVDFTLISGPWDVKIADIDGDLKPDLIVANQGVNYGQPSVSIFRNTSTTGAISFANKIDFLGGDAIRNLHVGDIDGDGKLDIITSGANGATILANKSTVGNILFAPKIVLPISGDLSYGICVNDLNGDGKPDLAIGEYWFIDSVAVFQNTSTSGNISFAPKVDYATDKFPRGVTAGDLDGDGKPDLAVIGNTSSPPQQVSILRNLSGNTTALICVGSSTSLNAGITGSTYQWQQNTGSGFSNISDNTVFSGTNSPTLQINNIPLTFNGYSYRCLSAGITGNATTLTLTAVPLIPSVSITASNLSICAGTSVLFTAQPVNGGSAPSYQWKKNAVNVGTNSNTYNSNALVNGDIISVILTSNSSCVSAPMATSNNLIVSVTASVTPAVSISASATVICIGTNIIFTAIPVYGGSSPVYQWKKNGINTGTNSASYNSSSLVNGDLITVTLTSNAPCATISNVASNSIAIIVNSAISPAINISGVTNVPQGTSIIISSSTSNAGSLPTYQWQDSTATHSWININGAIASSVNYTPLLSADKLRCILTTNNSCSLNNMVTSNALSFTVTRQFANVVFYPNPVTNFLVVDGLQYRNSWESVHVITMAGVKVISVPDLTGLTSVSVDVSILPPGIYMCVLSSRFGNAKYYKFVKL